MSLIQTLTATCDAEVAGPDGWICPARLKLRPNDTQPFQTLSRVGWSIVNAPAGYKIYCPEHPRGIA